MQSHVAADILIAIDELTKLKEKYPELEDSINIILTDFNNALKNMAEPSEVTFEITESYALARTCVMLNLISDINKCENNSVHEKVYSEVLSCVMEERKSIIEGKGR